MNVCLIINKDRRNSKTIISLFKKYFKNQSVVDVSKNKSQLLKIYNKKFDYVFSYLCPFKIKNDFLKKQNFIILIFIQDHQIILDLDVIILQFLIMIDFTLVLRI